MLADERYRQQVTLLVRTLPFVAEETCFALKGGTAINLFLRDLPRLSVDIDLAYLPVAGRAESLREIEEALSRIRRRIEKALGGVRVQLGATRGEHMANKLLGRSRAGQDRDHARFAGLCVRARGARGVAGS